MEKLPVIYYDIEMEDDKTGMDVISFVTSPATEIVWGKFNKTTHFAKNELKRIVTGPVMLAETPIYRYDDVIGGFYCKFSEETIFKMMKKYFMENKIHQVNEQHNGNRVVGNVYMVESFIVGDKVESKLYPELPKGTWMASFFIEDENYWNDVIMKDEFNGFSLEGNFTYHMENDIIDNIYSSIENILSSEITDEEKETKIKELLNIE